MNRAPLTTKKKKLRAVVFPAAALIACVARGTLGCAAEDAFEAGIEASTGEDARADAPSDAAADAPSDALADAAIPCSPDGFCHTALPAKGTFDAGSAVDNPLRPLTFELVDVWVAPDHTAWAVSREGHVLRWDGTIWSVAAVLEWPLLSVWGSGTSDVWIAGSGVFHGKKAPGQPFVFEKVAGPPSGGAASVRGTSPEDVWIISGNTTYRYTPSPPDGGAPWIPSAYPLTEGCAGASLTKMWSSGSDLLVLGRQFACDGGGSPPLFLRRASGADAWTIVDVDAGPGHALLTGGALPDGTQVLCAGVEGHCTSLLRGKDDAWTVEPTGVIQSLSTGVWGSSPDDIWIIGTPATVRRWDGTTWKIGRASLTAPLVAPLNAVHGDGTDMWIVGNNVALHRLGAP